MSAEPMSPERLAEIAKRATAEHLTAGPWQLDYESCDCGDGYPCGHGAYVSAVVTPDPTPVYVELRSRTGSPLPVYACHRTEMRGESRRVRALARAFGTFERDVATRSHIRRTISTRMS